jgi:tRNA 2-selenouridine synthase
MQDTAPLPESAFRQLSFNQLGPVIIDVRSEGEFAFAHFLGCKNQAILNDQERHEVGTTYKQTGQTEAVALGHALVGPHKINRVQKWVQFIKENAEQKSNPATAWVMCWRGGMRSAIACEWIQEVGYSAKQIPGGYKAIRSIALQTIENPPPAIIIAGPTGSEKTKLLAQLKLKGLPTCDLEHHAVHRGSAFGKHLHRSIPSQTQFENSIALDLFERPVIYIEDESKRIGDLFLPKPINKIIESGSSVIIHAELESRIHAIFQEYVLTPLQNHSPEEVLHHLLGSLTLLQKRLGLQGTKFIEHQMKQAFLSNPLHVDSHSAWIENLLVQHYDPLYARGTKRRPRKTLFEGNLTECLQFLIHHHSKTYA